MRRLKDGSQREPREQNQSAVVTAFEIVVFECTMATLPEAGRRSMVVGNLFIVKRG